jgi:hypothetical protein
MGKTNTIPPTFMQTNNKQTNHDDQPRNELTMSIEESVIPCTYIIHDYDTAKSHAHNQKNTQSHLAFERLCLPLGGLIILLPHPRGIELQCDLTECVLLSHSDEWMIDVDQCPCECDTMATSEHIHTPTQTHTGTHVHMCIPTIQPRTRGRSVR